jgi:hypothetical protein
VLRSPTLLISGVGIAISLVFPTAGVMTYLISAIVRGLPHTVRKRLLRF